MMIYHIVTYYNKQYKPSDPGTVLMATKVKVCNCLHEIKKCINVSGYMWTYVTSTHVSW